MSRPIDMGNSGNLDCPIWSHPHRKSNIMRIKFNIEWNKSKVQMTTRDLISLENFLLKTRSLIRTSDKLKINTNFATKKLGNLDSRN